jgi:hypothetical protein
MDSTFHQIFVENDDDIGTTHMMSFLDGDFKFL